MSQPTPKHVCCNPFKNHRAVQTNLRLINPTLVKLAKQLKIRLNVNKHICNKCRLRIEESPDASSSKPKEYRKSDESDVEESGAEESESVGESPMEVSFSKRDKVCCNSFSLHGDNVRRNLRDLTEELIGKAKLLNVTIEFSQSICDQCRRHLLRSAKPIEMQENVEDMDVDVNIEQQQESSSAHTTPEKTIDPSVECFDKTILLLLLLL